MLEREGHNILDSLDWGRERVTGKPLADDDLDAPDVIPRPPVVLKQELSAEVREPQPLELARLRELCSVKSALTEYAPESSKNEPHVLVIRCGPLTSRSRTVDLEIRSASTLVRQLAPCRHPRHQTPVTNNPGLKFDEVRMLAIGARKLAEIGPAPAVDRDLEPVARSKARHEARHNRDAHSAVDVSQL